MSVCLNPYKIPSLEISDFSKIFEKRERIHYVYKPSPDKTVHVLYKPAKDKTKNLLITFHGALPIVEKETMKLVPTPLFRGYDWVFDNVDVLCFFDPILDAYSSEGVQMGWFLDTKKMRYIDVYADICKFLAGAYEKIITTGSSAGGMPSLKFAGLCNGIAVIMNSQLYLPKTTQAQRR